MKNVSFSFYGSKFQTEKENPWKYSLVFIKLKMYQLKTHMHSHYCVVAE